MVKSECVYKMLMDQSYFRPIIVGKSLLIVILDAVGVTDLCGLRPHFRGRLDW